MKRIVFLERNSFPPGVPIRRPGFPHEWWSSTKRIPTGRRSGFGAPMSQSRTNAASTPPCSRPRRRWSSWRFRPPAPTAWTRRRRAPRACRSPMSPAMPRTAWPNMRSPCCLRSRAPCRPMTAPSLRGAGRRRAVSACSTIRSSTSLDEGSALSARASSAPLSPGRRRPSAWKRFSPDARARRRVPAASPSTKCWRPPTPFRSTAR